MTGWQLVFGIGLIAHGVGHALGIVPLIADITEGWNMRSWLLTDAIGSDPATAIAVALWTVCLAGFVVAGLGVLGIVVPRSWWRPLAVAMSVLSLVTLALFWNGLPFLVPNKVGAIGVDVILIAGILFAAWPTDEMLAA